MHLDNGFFNNPANPAFARICASGLTGPIPYIPPPGDARGILEREESRHCESP